MAFCGGSVPIGAVVVGTEGRVLGVGRKQRDEPEGREGMSGHLLAHAELNSLLAACSKAGDLRGCSLLTTMEPCPLCVGRSP